MEGCRRKYHAVGYCNSHYYPALHKGLIGDRTTCPTPNCKYFVAKNKVCLCCYNKARSKTPHGRFRQRTRGKRRRQNVVYIKKVISLNVKRRAKKLFANPHWANSDVISEIYKNCPKGYHVDHIVPLQNDKVCGLHIEYNLQYLTQEENTCKHNKFDGTNENESWRISYENRQKKAS